MNFSAVAEQGFPAIGDRFSHSACRGCAVVLARSSPSSRLGAGVARIDICIGRVDAIRAHACIDALAISSPPRPSDARHAICGTCMHAGDHRNRIDFAQRASTVVEMRVSGVVDTLNTSISARRSLRLHAYRRVEREKFACVVASTHRFFRHASRSAHVDARDDTERARGACTCSRCTSTRHRVLL